MVSYYYFLRYGDDYRKNKIRSRMGDKHTFDECVEKGLPDCKPEKLWQQVPWFCGHFRRCWHPPGNAWALEQAKNNLANKFRETMDIFCPTIHYIELSDLRKFA